MSDLDQELKLLRDATSRVGASQTLKRTMVLATTGVALKAGMTVTIKIVLVMALTTVIAGGAWVTGAVHLDTPTPVETHAVAETVIVEHEPPPAPGSHRSGRSRRPAVTRGDRRAGRAGAEGPQATLPPAMVATLLPPIGNDCLPNVAPAPKPAHLTANDQLIRLRLEEARIKKKAIVGVQIVPPPGVPLANVRAAAPIDSSGWVFVTVDEIARALWIEAPGYEPVIIKLIYVVPGEWSLGQVQFQPLKQWGDLLVHVTAPAGDPEVQLRGGPCGDTHSFYASSKGPS